MTPKTFPERRRALRITRACRHALWVAVGCEMAATCMAAFSHSKLAALFLFAAVFIAAFNVLVLGPMVRGAAATIDRDEQRAARLDSLYPEERDL